MLRNVYIQYESLHRIKYIDIRVRFMCIPAHSGIVGNEMADVLAKQALKQDRIMEVPYSKAETKAIIHNNIIK